MSRLAAARSWRRWLVPGLAAFALALPALAQRPVELGALDASAPIPYYIAAGIADSGYEPGDAELARWALAAWAAASQNTLEFAAVSRDLAHVLIYFVPASAGQYGVTRPIEIDGQRGAEVLIRPDMSALGPDIARQAEADPLLRDAIVYLTCLHEIGHALGLVHTSDYADVMYAFGYGGDIPAYFGRYRHKLESRDDIERVSGLSVGDLTQLATLYGLTPPPAAGRVTGARASP